MSGAEGAPAGLSPENEKEAIRLRAEHAAAAEKLRTLPDQLGAKYEEQEEKLAEARHILEFAKSPDVKEDAFKLIHEAEAAIDAHMGQGNGQARKAMVRAEDAYDANLWRVQQHKDEHLEEYIETAKQEAKAEGKDINTDSNSAESKVDRPPNNE